MKILIYSIVILLLISCENSEKKRLSQVVLDWQNREVIFPKDTSFVCYSRKFGEQKVHLRKGEFMILNYVDSTGCISCNLQLPRWSEFINTVDSISQGTIPFVFVFQSNEKKDLIHYLKRVGFIYPVFIDNSGSFERLNKFPSEMQFHTFLLDANGRIVAIGNPVHNPKVRKLYLNIIQGEKVVSNDDNKVRTEVSVKDANIALGRFDWQKEQKIVFTLKNVGDDLLLIEDVTTSCGCTTVTYSKEPVRSGQTVSLNVMYKAEQPEHFDKTITVYCNAKSSPVVLRITGDAE